MHTTVMLLVYLGALILLFVTRRRLGLFWSAAAFALVTLGYLKGGFEPPLPASVITMYGGTMMIALLLYVTSSERGRRAVWLPIRSLIVEPRFKPVLYALLALIPGAAALQSYWASLPSELPPPLIRSVHPSPPNSITIPSSGKKPRKIDLIKGDNPYRSLEKTNKSKFYAMVADGKRVYYQNCFYCHGDKLVADGHYASAMKPPPAKFNDEVLPFFQETYFFWRIAKGGPGLPQEGTPWDTAMPVWQNFLTEKEMWSALMFLYEQQGLRPRRQVAGAH